MRTTAFASRIDHLVLTTNEADKMLAFYEKLPGIRIQEERGRYALKFGNQKINLHLYPPALQPIAANPVVGGHEFYLLASGNGYRLQEQFSSFGIRIIKDCCPCDFISKAVFNNFYIEDPDRNLIRIKVDEHNQKQGLQFLKGITLAVADLAKSGNFYRDLLGFNLQSGYAEVICRSEDAIIRLITDRQRVVPGSGDFCLLVGRRLSTLYADLQKKKAPLIEGLGIVDRTGAEGPLKSIYLRDPDGNLVELAQPANELL